MTWFSVGLGIGAIFALLCIFLGSALVICWQRRHGRQPDFEALYNSAQAELRRLARLAAAVPPPVLAGPGSAAAGAAGFRDVELK